MPGEPRVMEVAGQHVTITDDGATTSVAFGPRRAGARACGDCQLCCRLVPAAALNKKANQRCRHQKTGKGCTIYQKRPVECATWFCRWLSDEKTHQLHRPDRSHYVVDMLRDEVRLIGTETSRAHVIDVIQVWCDPSYPEAWRDPHLMAYLARMAEQHGCAAIVRFANDRAITLLAPALTPAREWVEIASVPDPDARVGLYSRLGAAERPPL